ncbi:putative F-box domain, FBD domain, leucine-rich repeat domain, L domain-containing protein [Rosa chinensis]|uniref:Putative F-box domain, FBD domain, leucine-rich repeat domain, L domain-containing protein n=1 Tax=Rosa chinensis TaxID=74649 RepID=A0A2P6Q9A8_ROSCH|nr:F-box/FBD/LRR-repeat protein At1g78750 [Rosa chinensis]PRQ30768.1 putative F-box domain, FBD domain, leucine-rich repeat domain, L domain-containing protein [Rosa chinensis]
MSKSKARVKDRISALPDEVLCKVLSCLDIRYAVRTTVLSPRWNNLWTSLPNLCFCNDYFIDDDAFMTFVDRVLFFRDSSDIKKFCLDFDEPKEENFCRIESWICTAIRRNVVELDLSVNLYPDYKTFELPRSLFTCKTLEVLSLKSNFIANPPKSGCFPSLKVLEVLVRYPDLDNSSLEQIFAYCPVLEDLRIEGSLGECCDVLDFKISAPELKRLTIGLDIDSFDDEKYNFYINAPKLEVFNLPAGDSSVFSFEINAKSLFKANINLSSCCIHFDSTNGLLEAISNVKQLSLSTRNLEGGVPAFDNLNHLELILGGSTCWRYLIEFLKRSPNLEHLVIKHDCGFKHEDFTPLEFVPVCMLSHLKTITIASFRGSQDNMRVAQYLLKYSEVLNKMIFTISEGLPNAEEKALYKEFLMFERGSKTCQVEIYN